MYVSVFGCLAERLVAHDNTALMPGIVMPTMDIVRHNPRGYRMCKLLMELRVIEITFSIICRLCVFVLMKYHVLTFIINVDIWRKTRYSEAEIKYDFSTRVRY